MSCITDSCVRYSEHLSCHHDVVMTGCIHRIRLFISTTADLTSSVDPLLASSLPESIKYPFYTIQYRIRIIILHKKALYIKALPVLIMIPRYLYKPGEFLYLPYGHGTSTPLSYQIIEFSLRLHIEHIPIY